MLHFLGSLLSGTVLAIINLILTVGCVAAVLAVIAVIIRKVRLNRILNMLPDSDYKKVSMPTSSEDFSDKFLNKATDFKDSRLDLLSVMLEHHNLLKHDVETDDEEDDHISLHSLKDQMTNVQELYTLAIVFLSFWVVLYLSIVAIHIKSILGASLLAIAMMILLAVLIVIVFMTTSVAKKLAREANNIDESRQDAMKAQTSVELIDALPRVKFDTGRVLFTKYYALLRMIYQANRNAELQINQPGVFTGKLTDSLRAAWMTTNTENFQAMTDVTQKLAQDPEAMQELIKNDDPVNKQVADWTSEYKNFLRGVVQQWIDLSDLNKKYYLNYLIQNHMTDDMDAATRAKYISSIGKSIDELTGDAKDDKSNGDVDDPFSID